MRALVFSIFIGSSLSACGPSKSSLPLEAIDEANSLLLRYGLSEMPLYDDIKNQTSVSTKDRQGHELLPWTDSYWPTTEKGMARRWGPIKSKDEPNLDSEADFSFGAFYKLAREEANRKGVISVNFSPGEKFDFVYQFKNQMNPDDAVDILDKLGRIDDELELVLANDRLDDRSRISAKRALASRYYNQLRHVGSDGRRIDNYFPMTTEAVKSWLAKAKSDAYQFPGEYSESEEGQSWSWEGLCHGWAIAALMSEEPKHSVLVNVGLEAERSSKSVLFTEGDIRGLLTKTWAESNHDEMFFVGRRCEENVDDASAGVTKNGNGRAIGGSFYRRSGSGRPVPTNFTLVQEYPHATGHLALFRIILENEWRGRQPRFAYLLQDLTQNSYFFIKEEVEAFAAAESGDTANLESVQGVFFHGCWDINPASFHTALLANIGYSNRGLVMDRTQSGQVWNQPIYKVAFEIGELKPMKELPEDVAKYYRAPGTSYLASVKAKVYWTSEPWQPLFSYGESGQSDLDEDYVRTSNYQYTLEFDADQRLIGGEWSNLESFNVPEPPDFIFGFRAPAEPRLFANSTSGYLGRAYQDIVKKIHNCSLQERKDGEILVKIPTSRGEPEDTKFEYVNCVL